MIDDLEKADKAETHTETQKAACVGHKGYHCDFLKTKKIV
jgi:hypothetical protein